LLCDAETVSLCAASRMWLRHRSACHVHQNRCVWTVSTLFLCSFPTHVLPVLSVRKHLCIVCVPPKFHNLPSCGNIPLASRLYSSEQSRVSPGYSARSVTQSEVQWCWCWLRKCSVLQCVAVCCNALQSVVVGCSVLKFVAECSSALQFVAVISHMSRQRAKY